MTPQPIEGTKLHTMLSRVHKYQVCTYLLLLSLQVDLQTGTCRCRFPSTLQQPVHFHARAVYAHCFVTHPVSQLTKGAEESSLQFHEGRPLAALAWVAQQPRQGAAVSRTDEEVDHLAEVGAAYADRCEHILGPSDRLPGGNGGSSGGVGGRSSSDYGSQGDDGFALLEVKCISQRVFRAHIFVVVVQCTLGTP